MVLGDFVNTQDGTGIVHMAPSFGADDNRVAKQNGIGSLTLVDKQGKFLNTVTDFANMYVKNEYYEKEEDRPKLSVDIQIVIYLKEKDTAFIPKNMNIHTRIVGEPTCLYCTIH